MLPHDGVGGRTPTPRIASAPSATIATAMPSSAIENIAGSTFGSTSRTMMRPFFAPWARAASTNSRCDQLSALARVIRPSSGIVTMPIAMISMTSGGMPPPFAAWSATAEQERAEREREDDRRDREEHVEHAREVVVDVAVSVAGDPAEDGPDDDAEHTGDVVVETDHHREEDAADDQAEHRRRRARRRSRRRTWSPCRRSSRRSSRGCRR